AAQRRGRMQEQAVFGYFFPRKKVTRRKGGRGPKSHHIKWISPQPKSPNPKGELKPGAISIEL
ncbi:hypothetical protein, partial [Pseudomonas hunanensis]|uniref:hypothetical protein n=1 Tax=Pseudomonas hunanensis TaxID=1247546 RepID=UPI00286BB758